jgi:hypothetical protein
VTFAEEIEAAVLRRLWEQILTGEPAIVTMIREDLDRFEYVPRPPRRPRPRKAP